MQKETWEKVLNVLGSSEEEAAVEYRKLHQRLSRFFEWNGVEDPAALADEAFDRLGKRMSEENVGHPINSPSAFTLGIARLLLQEEVRRQQRKKDALRYLETQDPVSVSEAEAMDAALQHCLAKLPPSWRLLLEQYYLHNGSEKVKLHQKLADELRITINALRNRALRARQDLEACMRKFLRENVR